MKVLYKLPEDKYGKIIEIENSLSALQGLVGGFIEVISYDYNAVLICNEEGMLKGLKPNMICDAGLIVGPVVICGVKGEEFTDIDPILVESLKGYLLPF